MAQRDVDTVRRFASLLPGDWVVARRAGGLGERFEEQTASLLHEDFTVVPPEELIALGAPRTVSGRILDFYGDWLDTFESYREEFTNFVDAGPGRVLAFATVGGRTKTGGVEILREGGAVYELEEGLILSIRLYMDPKEARAAAGL